MYRVDAMTADPESAQGHAARDALAMHLAQRVWQAALEHVPDSARTSELYLAIRATIEAELQRHVEGLQLNRRNSCEWEAAANAPCREIDALLTEIAS